MDQILKGKDLAEKVLRNTGGASIKRMFKIDTINYSWIDSYLRDKALREKIDFLRQKIKEVQTLPIHRDELKTTFKSALESIKNERVAWLRDLLTMAQNRQGAMINSHRLKRGDYILELGLSQKDIDNAFNKLPVGVKQADIELETKRLHEEIAGIEKIITDELSPSSRFIYNDDGSTVPYPQGCRWTQFVNAWEAVVPRFEGTVDIEGAAINSECERTAYTALGLNKISKITPLRKPL